MRKRIITFILIALICVSCSVKKQPDITDDNYRVFYEIFTGSFSDSDGDGIGDLRGIINRLDYLNDGNINSTASLGVQGLWLTPIFLSPSYHKYDTTDYYRIDPAFGTQDDLDELISKCHEMNMLVILDLAINHTSSDNEWFRQFKKAHQNNDYGNKYYNYYVYSNSYEKPYNRSFCSLDGTDEAYECNFSYDMPELNFDEPQVRQEVLDIASYYLNKGIDGFRFDAAKYIYYTDNGSTIDFWKWYLEQLRNIKEDIYIVSEVWSGENEVNEYISQTNCFNFAMAQPDGLIAKTAKGGDINVFSSYIENYQNTLKNINPKAMPISFISNHDMDRSAGYLNVENGQAFIAADLYLLSPGSPFVYYGEEIGMKGSRGSSNTDANRRLKMLWGDSDTIESPDGSDYNEKSQINGTVADQLKDKNSLLNNYMKLIRIRKNYPQIARGNFTRLDLGRNDLGGFRVDYQENSIYIIHNTSDSQITIKSPQFKKLLQYAGFSEASFKNNELVIGPYTTAILE